MNIIQAILVIPMIFFGWTYFATITSLWQDYVKINNVVINSLLYLSCMAISTIPFIYLLKSIY